MADPGDARSGAPARPDDDRAWWAEPDPVDAFSSAIELGLRQLRVEVAGLRAERDGLRLEVEGLRAKLAVAHEQLAARDSLADTVGQLRGAIDQLTAERLTPKEPSALSQLRAMGLYPPRPNNASTTIAPAPTVEPAPVTVVTEPEPVAESEPATEPRTPRRRSLVRRILNAVLGVVTVLVIVAALAVTVGPKVLPYQTYAVRSGSMEPAIPTGALVVLTKADAADLEAGDVITFEKPGDADVRITHRIFAVESNDGARVFITKGDANATPDPWVVPGSGTGWEYAFDVPWVGYVFRGLSTPGARLLLLSIPVVILVLSFRPYRRRSR